MLCNLYNEISLNVNPVKNIHKANSKPIFKYSKIENIQFYQYYITTVINFPRNICELKNCE